MVACFLNNKLVIKSHLFLKNHHTYELKMELFYETLIPLICGELLLGIQNESEIGSH